MKLMEVYDSTRRNIMGETTISQQNLSG